METSTPSAIAEPHIAMETRYPLSTFRFAVALATSIVLVGESFGEKLPDCPRTLTAIQQPQAVPEGWTSMAYIGPQALDWVEFCNSPECVRLRPDSETQSKDEAIYSWEVEGMANLRVVCNYGGTGARVTRVVTGTPKLCEVVVTGTSADTRRFVARCD